MSAARPHALPLIGLVADRIFSCEAADVVTSVHFHAHLDAAELGRQDLGLLLSAGFIACMEAEWTLGPHRQS